jgi:hypothetical protein
VAEQEDHTIALAAYFAQEIVTMLDAAGFVDVRIEGRYTEEPATSDDATVVFAARRPA